MEYPWKIFVIFVKNKVFAGLVGLKWPRNTLSSRSPFSSKRLFRGQKFSITSKHSPCDSKHHARERKGPHPYRLLLRPTPKSVPASHYLFSFSFTPLHAERSSLRTSRSHFSTCVRERERECKREREKKRNARRSLSLPGQTHARVLTRATRWPVA